MSALPFSPGDLMGAKQRLSSSSQPAQDVYVRKRPHPEGSDAGKLGFSPADLLQAKTRLSGAPSGAGQKPQPAVSRPGKVGFSTADLLHAKTRLSGAPSRQGDALKPSPRASTTAFSPADLMAAKKKLSKKTEPVSTNVERGSNGFSPADLLAARNRLSSANKMKEQDVLPPPTSSGAFSPQDLLAARKRLTPSKNSPSRGAPDLPPRKEPQSGAFNPGSILQQRNKLRKSPKKNDSVGQDAKQESPLNAILAQRNKLKSTGKRKSKDRRSKSLAAPKSDKPADGLNTSPSDLVAILATQKKSLKGLGTKKQSFNTDANTSKAAQEDKQEEEEEEEKAEEEVSPQRKSSRSSQEHDSQDHISAKQEKSGSRKEKKQAGLPEHVLVAQRLLEELECDKNANKRKSEKLGSCASVELPAFVRIAQRILQEINSEEKRTIVHITKGRQEEAPHEEEDESDEDDYEDDEEEDEEEVCPWSLSEVSEWSSTHGKKSSTKWCGMCSNQVKRLDPTGFCSQICQNTARNLEQCGYEFPGCDLRGNMSPGNQSSKSKVKSNKNTVGKKGKKPSRHEGYLQKKPVSLSFSTSWKTRWFVLEGRELSYHEKKDGRQLGKCILQPGSSISEVKNQPLCFQLSNVEGFKKPLIVQCGSDKIRAEWTLAIEQAIGSLGNYVF